MKREKEKKKKGKKMIGRRWCTVVGLKKMKKVSKRDVYSKAKECDIYRWRNPKLSHFQTLIEP